MLDESKLYNVVHQSDGFSAQCPACAAIGRDKSSNHLKVWSSNGAYCCIINKGDIDHNREIYSLVGLGQDAAISDREIRYEEVKIKLPPRWPLTELGKLVPNHQYWMDRGINKQTCEKFRIGYASKGLLFNRSVIPILSYDKSYIIGFTARKLETTKTARPKWKHLNPSASFIFPYQPHEVMVRKNIVITEGPADVLTLETHGILNSICLFGTVPSSKVLSYLLSLNLDHIYIATNNELDSANGGVGNEAADKIKAKLSQFFNDDKLTIALPPKKDFNEMNKMEIIEYKNKWKL